MCEKIVLDLIWLIFEVDFFRTKKVVIIFKLKSSAVFRMTYCNHEFIAVR